MLVTHQDWTIRYATEKDLPELSQLAKETFAATFKEIYTPDSLETIFEENFSEVALRNVLMDQSHKLIIALDSKPSILGYMDVVFHTQVTNLVKSAPSWELKRLYLHSSCHGKGLAPLMMEQYFELAQDHCKWLSVFTDNFRAKKFYSKYGFSKIGEHLWSQETLANGQQDIDEVWLWIDKEEK
jgi:ribosomal protein S18 acetylase RimI-like enzyme